MMWKTLSSTTAVCILMRHAERFDIVAGSVGVEVPLTEKGRCDSREWGVGCQKMIRNVFSSPIPRCVDTAKYIAEGALHKDKIVLSHELGDPGPFVLDGEIAWQNWKRKGNAEVNRILMTTQKVLPGMVSPLIGARRLVDFMLTSADDSPGIHVFVTHDNILAVTIAQLTGMVAEYEGTGWPDFLQASAWWRSDSKLYCEWEEHVFELTSW